MTSSFCRANAALKIAILAFITQGLFWECFIFSLCDCSQKSKSIEKACSFTDASHQIHITRHNGDALAMDCSNVCVLHHVHKEAFGSFLWSKFLIEAKNTNKFPHLQAQQASDCPFQLLSWSQVAQHLPGEPSEGGFRDGCRGLILEIGDLSEGSQAGPESLSNDAISGGVFHLWTIFFGIWVGFSFELFGLSFNSYFFSGSVAANRRDGASRAWYLRHIQSVRWAVLRASFRCQLLLQLKCNCSLLRALWSRLKASHFDKTQIHQNSQSFHYYDDFL